MALASGTYIIVSAQIPPGDGHLCENDSGTIQLAALEDHGQSNDQKFQVTLTADGTYSIYSLTAGANSGIDAMEPQDIGPGGVQALVVVGVNTIRWNIQRAPNDAIAWNIVFAGTQNGWNRVEGDNKGRLQLRNVTAQDSHNNWYFEAR